MKKADDKITPFWQEVSLMGEKEIISDLAEKKGTSLFLGRYSLSEVSAVLSKRNFFKEAKKRGLWPLVQDLDSSEYPLQRFRIFHKEKQPETTIVDLKIREGIYCPKYTLDSDSCFPEYNFLILEWLTLQNPLLSFCGERTPLPGQTHPGLNLGKKVLDIFVYLGRLTRKDGLLAFPAYFHNAVLFSRYFKFINPEKQAEVLAIREACSAVSLKQLAWIIHLNCLKDKNGKVYEWKASEQVYPLERTLREYCDSKTYKEKVKSGRKKFQFSVDWKGFHTKFDGQIP